MSRQEIVNESVSRDWFNDCLESEFVLWVCGEDVNGEYAFLESVADLRDGPPMHVHQEEALSLDCLLMPRHNAAY